MRTIIRTAVLSLGFLALGPGLVSAKQSAPIRYQLESGSAFTAGCLPPCLCATIYSEAIGSLEMTRAPLSPQFAVVHNIDNISIVLGTATGGGLTLVTGTGTYLVSSQLGNQQRMVLDLLFNGAEPTQYDSGWVPMSPDYVFPSIGIIAAENAFSCFDRLWDLRLTPDLATNFCTSVPNSTGMAGVISASGSSNITANDLQLHASFLPANKPAIFFFGGSADQVPFGDGVRCVGGPNLTRFAPGMTSATGSLSMPVDNGNLPNGVVFFPGSIWHFQGWFRDSAAGQSGFNLTDGTAILFAP